MDRPKVKKKNTSPPKTIKIDVTLRAAAFHGFISKNLKDCCQQEGSKNLHRPIFSN